MTRTFTCFVCREVCTTDWTEEEAWAEAEENYGPRPPDGKDDKVSLCDDCHVAARSILAAYGINAGWNEPEILSPLNGLRVRCMRCHRSPIQIPEYREAVAEEGKVSIMTVLAYVVTEEGTYNKQSGQFACTECYLALGSPVGKGGQRWIAP